MTAAAADISWRLDTSEPIHKSDHTSAAIATRPFQDRTTWHSKSRGGTQVHHWITTEHADTPTDIVARMKPGPTVRLVATVKKSWRTRKTSSVGWMTNHLHRNSTAIFQAPCRLHPCAPLCKPEEVSLLRCRHRTCFSSRYNPWSVLLLDILLV